MGQALFLHSVVALANDRTWDCAIVKFPWTKEIEALRTRVGELERRIETLETKPPVVEAHKSPRLMTSARTPSLIRKLEARDIAKMNTPGKIVRNRAKGPEPA